MRRVIPSVLVSLTIAVTLGLFLLAPRSALVRSKLDARRRIQLPTDAVEIGSEVALP